MDDPVKVTVSLTSYEWHRLLKELEYIQQICNRDNSYAIDMWEKISTELSGYNQIVQGSAKHKTLCPEEFKKLEQPKVEQKPIEKGFLARLFGG
jgi:hypothetical protein